MSANSNLPSDKRATVFHGGLKIFGYVVVLLIAVAILYSIWIMLANWSHIGV